LSGKFQMFLLSAYSKLNKYWRLISLWS